MHHHLPSLFSKATSLLPHLSHFLRSFVRFIDVGFLSTQTWSGIFPRKPIKQKKILRSVKTATRLPRSATETDHLLEVGSMVQSVRPDPLNRSLPPPKIAGQRQGKKIIISVHIPKTGGTTFVDMLRPCAEEVLYLDYGEEGPAPTALFYRGKRVSEPFEPTIDNLESLPGRSIIHGHFAAKKYIGRFPNAVYVTWLRDPVERVVSNYFYWQRTYLPGDARWERVVGQKMSLEQFAQLDFARNVQFRWLSPLGVERFDFVGITEEYDRSLELFRRLFFPEINFKTMVHKFCNPNRRGKFYDLNPKLRAKILELNELDAYTCLNGIRHFRNLCAKVGLTCWFLVLQFGCGGKTDPCDYLVQSFF